MVLAGSCLFLMPSDALRAKRAVRATQRAAEATQRAAKKRKIDLRCNAIRESLPDISAVLHILINEYEVPERPDGKLVTTISGLGYDDLALLTYPDVALRHLILRDQGVHRLGPIIQYVSNQRITLDQMMAVENVNHGQVLRRFRR